MDIFSIIIVLIIMGLVLSTRKGVGILSGIFSRLTILLFYALLTVLILILFFGVSLNDVLDFVSILLWAI